MVAANPEEGRGVVPVRGGCCTAPPGPSSDLYAHSPWWPRDEIVELARRLSNKAAKRNWVYRETPKLFVPAAVTHALVILEGKRSGGWDIDAYFDDCKLRWEIHDNP